MTRSLTLLSAIVLGAVMSGCSPGEGEESRAKPLVVETRTVSYQSGYDLSRAYLGRIEAARRSETAFDLGGEVVGANVDEGERVKEGAALARLDTDRLTARKAELEAAISQARADLTFAERVFERRVNAESEYSYSPEEVDRARRQRDTAAAALERARAQLTNIEVDIRKSTLRAPFDAVVVRRHVDEGDVVSAGTPAFDLIEDTAPEARIGVAGRLQERLSEGAEMSVTVEDDTYSARVRALVPRRDTAARTSDAILVVDATWRQVNEGDLVKLHLDRRVKARVAQVPMTALVESARGLWAVYAAVPLENDNDAGEGATHRIERREIELVHQRADRGFVRGALGDGDVIVATAPFRIVPGLEVTTRPAGETSRSDTPAPGEQLTQR